ncbi:MetQ/NlpA family ABC transporter substrate-binding protein [Brachyspira murdochii]|uniref:Membrane protein n=1 Tax=Brachyspira murdochii TaxID=84378 RepID=A0ABX5B765_9SPIR|nr:MetQ/NlpA family ABC transporter substrate-binding protein [Brachyspira murdochii]PPS22491.1 membrane protein [Brachyspira murdochii]
MNNKILKIMILLFLIISCSKENKKDITVKLGCIGEFDTYVLESLKGKLEKENIILDLITFSDYSVLNKALVSKAIDLNHFQHYAYFVNETNKNDYYLSIIAKTFIADMNMYSDNLTNIGQIGLKSKIAVPEDDINLSRALKILDSIGFIRLKENNNKNHNFTFDDVRENYLLLEFVPIKSSDMHSIISKVDAAIVNYHFNFDFRNSNIIYKDDPSKYQSDMYVNVVAARLEDENNITYKTIANLYKEKVSELINSGKIESITMID